MSDRIKAITMPKWGLAMTEGAVTRWLVAQGGEIREGDEILEIETTKITNVFESPLTGLLRRRVAAEGETVPVGALLGVVAEPSVPDAEIDAFVTEFHERFAAEASEAAAEPEPKSITAGDHKFRYLVMGEGGGTPILLIHGFGGDLNNWQFNQPVLAESRTVYALDLPGHGESAKSPVGGIVEMTGAVVTFLDALDITRAHLVGHSMGGAIALQLALDHSDRVASVTLVNSAGLGPDINMDYIQGFIRADRRKDLKPVVEMLFADPSLVTRDLLDDLLKFKRLDGVHPALETIAGAAFPNGHQAVLFRDRLSDLKMPVQAIWGTADRIVPAAHAEALPADARHLFEDAGHMVHMEKAAQVNRLILDFIVRSE